MIGQSSAPQKGWGRALNRMSVDEAKKILGIESNKPNQHLVEKVQRAPN